MRALLLLTSILLLTHCNLTSTNSYSREYQVSITTPNHTQIDSIIVQLSIGSDSTQTLYTPKQFHQKELDSLHQVTTLTIDLNHHKDSEVKIAYQC